MSFPIIKDLLREQAQLLKNKSADLAVLESRLLMGYVLNCTRADLILRADDAVSLDQAELFKACVARRLQGEPISKICQHKEFWGMSFIVTLETLDPRPDTETIVEAILERTELDQGLSVLDLGTGTGCILLSILSERLQAIGVGVDISVAALDVAIQNANALGLSQRAKFIQSSWAENVDGFYDIIVSNPPYIREDEYENLSPDVKNYDPKIALVSGSDGLECYRKIAPAIYKHLAQNGFFAIEVGVDQEKDVACILKENNLAVLDIRKDLAGIFRCIVGCKAG